MKCLPLWLPVLLWLAAPPGLQAQVAPGQELIRLPANGSVQDLTLNSQVATSVSFPSDITMVSGYGMVLDTNAAQELINAEKMASTMSRDMAVTQPVTIIHYAQASSDTLIMRAVRPGTPCYLTVRCGADIFLFKLDFGARANLAVIMSDPAASKNEGVREVKPVDVVKNRTVFSSAELVGILSKAKQREFLETVNPAIYEGWMQRRGVALTATHGEVVSTIQEVQQWPLKDAVVLRARLDNRGRHMFRFKPVDVQVRVGDRSYNVQLADGNGEVPAGGSSQLDVVMQGNSLGGKEHLSIQNDFRLEIAEDVTSGPPPNDLLPPPAPLMPTIESKGRLTKQEVIYEGNGAILPQDPIDRSIPLPNLYGKYPPHLPPSMLAYLQKPAVQMALFFVAVAGAGAFFYMQDQKPAAAAAKAPPKGMSQASTETVNVARTEVKSSETTESVKLDKLSLPPSKPEPPTIVSAPPPKTEEKPKPPKFPELVQVSNSARPRPFVPQQPAIFAPRGTLIKVALVITLESNAIGTPVLGMVIEDVYFQGNLIVPAGTQVQGSAFANSRFRDRIDVRGSFTFVWADGSEYTMNAVALDHQPLSDGTFSLTDGSPGIRGRILKTDEYAELKLLVAEALQGIMTNQQSQFQSIYGLVPENTTRNAALGGGASGAEAYAGLLSKKIEKDLEYVQVPAGTSFYLYTLDVFEPELRSVAGLRQGNQPMSGVDEQRSMYEAVTAQFQVREDEAKAKLEEARTAAAAAEKAKQSADRAERTKALFSKPEAPPRPASSSSSSSSSSQTMPGAGYLPSSLSRLGINPPAQ